MVDMRAKITFIIDVDAGTDDEAYGLIDAQITNFYPPGDWTLDEVRVLVPYVDYNPQ